MAAIKNYSITFKSLRAGITYTLNIGGGTGTAVALKGGAEPFVTGEDDGDDFFSPIRTQSGYLNIIDDGYAADGVTAFDWKDLVPESETSRPVTLTCVRDSATVVCWQGFLQPQSFSGMLYGNPQTRAYPVQCALSALPSIQAPMNERDVKNFAYLIQYIFQQLPDTMTYNTFVFQGGANARAWLQRLFDWQNFVNVSDSVTSAKYNLQEILTDVCKFWGWTCRTWRTQVIFTCADDSGEADCLVLTAAQLATLAADNEGESTAGGISTMYTGLTMADCFSSTDVEDTVESGVSKAVVKADCNAQSEVIAFAPQSVRFMMEENGYVWYQPGDDQLVGYFTTEEITSFESLMLNGSAKVVNNTPYGAFCRRQIYATEKATSADMCDEVMIKHSYVTQGAGFPGVALVQLATTHDRIYSGGSLKLSGAIKKGCEDYVADNQVNNMRIRVGIGQTYATAKWFYLTGYNTTPSYGWGNTMTDFRLKSNFNLGYSVTMAGGIPLVFGDYPSIPVDTGMYGKIFVDFLGCDNIYPIGDEFEIANFTLEYSRDAAAMLGERTRVLKADRASTREYSATNSGKGNDNWYADCIFASDNNMKYGYGLLMNPGGSFMSQVPYGALHTDAVPEQHLANRVAAYWSNPKRRVSAPVLATGELAVTGGSTSVMVMDVSPKHTITIDGTRCHVVAISDDWRDDERTLVMMEV